MQSNGGSSAGMGGPYGPRQPAPTPGQGRVQGQGPQFGMPRPFTQGKLPQQAPTMPPGFNSPPGMRMNQPPMGMQGSRPQVNWAEILQRLGQMRGPQRPFMGQGGNPSRPVMQQDQKQFNPYR